MTETERLEVLDKAWSDFREARRNLLMVNDFAEQIKAKAMADFRAASEARVTVDMVNSNCQKHPMYRQAVAACRKADDELWAAVAQLERAWALNGLAGQKITGRPGL